MIEKLGLSDKDFKQPLKRNLNEQLQAHLNKKVKGSAKKWKSQRRNRRYKDEQIGNFELTNTITKKKKT